MDKAVDKPVDNEAVSKLSSLRPILLTIAKEKSETVEYAAAMIELRRLTREWFG